MKVIFLALILCSLISCGSSHKAPVENSLEKNLFIVDSIKSEELSTLHEKKLLIVVNGVTKLAIRKSIYDLIGQELEKSAITPIFHELETLSETTDFDTVTSYAKRKGYNHIAVINFMWAEKKGAILSEYTRNNDGSYNGQETRSESMFTVTTSLFVRTINPNKLIYKGQKSNKVKGDSGLELFHLSHIALVRDLARSVDKNSKN